ncbi:MAG: glucose-6-phosphate isomerase family protein [Paludibacter sp.]|nr:glucose-6-phosphate isomerase family protein [Paludibacter sp.]
MHHLKITNPLQQVNLQNWQLSGQNIINSEKLLSQMVNIYEDEAARQILDQQTLVYKVQAYLPVKEGIPGGLFFGTTIIQPGKVGDEYFMTRGHFHLNADRAEYYWGVQGRGMLILMDEQRNVWAERMFPGSLHYIGSHIAHRMANVGNEPLMFGACWPSDAGHNYKEIDEKGFSARLLELSGEPVLIENK